MPFVPATSAPRTASCGSPSSRSSARVRPRPRRIPNRPRSARAASASCVGAASAVRVRTSPADARHSRRQVVLVEDALVEARRQADVVDVALLHVDAAAELAARDVRVLADQRLQQVRRLDRDRAARARSCRSAGRRSGGGSAARTRRATAASREAATDRLTDPAGHARPDRHRRRAAGRPVERGCGVVAPILHRRRRRRSRPAADPRDRTDAERGPAHRATRAISLWVSSLHPSLESAHDRRGGPRAGPRKTTTLRTRQRSLRARSRAARSAAHATIDADDDTARRATTPGPAPAAVDRTTGAGQGPTPRPGPGPARRPIAGSTADPGIALPFRLLLGVAVVALGVGVLLVANGGLGKVARRDRLDVQRLRHRHHDDARPRAPPIAGRRRRAVLERARRALHEPAVGRSRRDDPGGGRRPGRHADPDLRHDRRRRPGRRDRGPGRRHRSTSSSRA